MIREAGEEKWHLIQLLLQIDTVFAPAAIPLKPVCLDDPHVLVRKHGGSALDNALLVGNGGWIDNAWDLRCVKNNVAEDVPHHYVLVVHSLSEGLHGFWEDLEWARRNNGHVVAGNMSGEKVALGSRVWGKPCCFHEYAR